MNSVAFRDPPNRLQQVVGGLERDGVHHTGTRGRTDDEQRTVVRTGALELGQRQRDSSSADFAMS